MKSIKEELAKQYADNRRCPDESKGSTQFNCYDIEQAYKDGFDKAVELAVGFIDKVASGYAIRELLTGEPYEGKIIGDFKKYMEENI